jgi:hypothetical protein
MACDALERFGAKFERRLADVMRQYFQAKALEVPALGGIERFQQHLLHSPDRRERPGERLAS